MFSSHQELIEHLWQKGTISSLQVKELMLKINRKDFVVKSEEAFRDKPSQIGFGATISAPHMHAWALEKLKDHILDKTVLDVGSGSGYLCVAFAELGAQKVVGIDHVPQLVEMSIQNISKNYKHYLDTNKVSFVCGDARHTLLREFDVIHVGAGCEEIPVDLLGMLKCGGRLIAPVGVSENQKMTIVDKDFEGGVSVQNEMSVRYIPLTELSVQCPNL